MANKKDYDRWGKTPIKIIKTSKKVVKKTTKRGK